MSRFTTTELRVHQAVGFVVWALGLVALFLTKPPFDPAGPWAHASFKLNRESWLAVVLGFVWLGLAAAYLGGKGFAGETPSRRGQIVVIVPGVAVALSLLALFMASPWNPTDYSAVYAQGWHGAGWMLAGVGMALTGIAFVCERTRFFDTEAPISADRLMLTWAITIIVTGLVLYLVLPAMPATPARELPPDPDARQKILALESHFRQFVAAFIVVTAGCIAAIPTIRFFRKAG